jgi:hypothetical protein
MQDERSPLESQELIFDVAGTGGHGAPCACQTCVMQSS